MHPLRFFRAEVVEGDHTLAEGVREFLNSVDRRHRDKGGAVGVKEVRKTAHSWECADGGLLGVLSFWRDVFGCQVNELRSDFFDISQWQLVVLGENPGDLIVRHTF